MTTKRANQALGALKRLGVNIEKHRDSGESISEYFPTEQSLRFVGQIASASLQGGDAFSLQGAYGVGKSSLAMFALNELSCPTKTFTPKALKTLPPSIKPQIAKIRKQVGLLALPMVASSRPLTETIAASLKKLAHDHKGTKPKALRACLKINPEQIAPDKLIGLLASLATAAKEQGRVGILLIIDEFGRQLEQIVAGKVMADLHLLQNLAEVTGTTTSPISLIIIQHYGLEQYSTKLLSDQRSEWDKVRGRFREVTLNNTETDTANIIGQLFQQHMSGKNKKGMLSIARWHKDISLPVLREKAFSSAATRCSPLHPITIILLSRISRLLGQSDRTVVGWLTSSMSTGFAAAADQSGGGWVYPASLFDHFFGDAQMVPSNPVVARRYAAIQSAYERLRESSDADAVMLLQTIALLNFCGGGGLEANIATIKACLPRSTKADKSLKALMEKSLVVHRRHRQEYFVWEGSDYDLSGRISETIEQMDIDLVGALNQRESRKILAHAHLIKTGNYRIADLLWLNASTPVPPPTKVDVPRVLVWLEQTPNAKCASAHDVWAVVPAIRGLEGNLREIIAINHLLVQDQALQDDLAAQAEIRRQLSFREEQALTTIDNILNVDITWHVGKKQHGSLQKAVSAAMDKAYPKALELHNELINRDVASGQVTSAIRLLIGGMFNRPELDRLGIEKFPAELIIYNSLLREKKIHVLNKNKKQWHLTLSDGEIASDVKEIMDVLMQEFATDNPTGIMGVVERLEAPPYGLKRIPALLLCAIFLLLKRDQVELHEDRLYLPNWGEQTLVRMMRSPQSFALAASAVSDVGTRTMKKYRQAISNPIGDGTDSPINLARDLLMRYERLSVYARQTLSVSEQAQAFRRAIGAARSPRDMLFGKLPNALNFPSFQSKKATEYFRSLTRVWKELEGADNKLRERFRCILLKSSGVKTLGQARSLIIKQAKQMQKSDMIYHDHKRFLRAVMEEKKDAAGWLEILLDRGLNIKTPLDSWGDDDAALAEFLLRRNLLGLQESVSILSECVQSKNNRAFAVFWTSPPDMEIDKAVEKHLLPLFDEVPEDQRMQQVMILAQRFRELDGAS